MNSLRTKTDHELIHSFRDGDLAILKMNGLPAVKTHLLNASPATLPPTAVEAILDLRNQYGILGSDVASIQISGSQRMATTNNIPAPPDILIAQFSIPFCVALKLYRNPIDPYSFDEAAVHDQRSRLWRRRSG